MKDKKGFTLAELLIVVAIIGVLVAVSIPIFSSQLEKSKQATDLANMRSAKAAAIAEWMSDGMPADYNRKYDATSGTMTDSTPVGYGKSSKAVTAFDTVMEGASGVPNSDGTAHYITVSIDEDGTILMNWDGVDLSTSEGRVNVDKNNMDSIAKALIQGLKDGLFTNAVNKNFVAVAVYPDGTVDYYSDKHSGDSRDDEHVSGIKQALINAGISEDKLKSYVQTGDSQWQYGYTVMYDYNNKTMYLLSTAHADRNGHISSSTWSSRQGKIIEEYKVE